MRLFRRGWPILVATICMFAPLSWSWPSRTWANGGTPRFTAVEAEPYLIPAWSQPDPPQVGRLHVSVAVMTPSTREAILDAEVQLVAELAGQRKQSIVVQATHEAGANALLYHGNFELPQAGPWQITVLVEGPAGPRQRTFSLQVEPPSLGGVPSFV